MQKQSAKGCPKISRGKTDTITLKVLQQNFLATLMWRRPLNKAILAALTHKGAWGGVRWDKHSRGGLDGQQVEG